MIVKERISIPILKIQIIRGIRKGDQERKEKAGGVGRKLKEEGKEKESRPSGYLPTSGAATSLTREANWSLSL